jgi:hypothetical protein
VVPNIKDAHTKSLLSCRSSCPSSPAVPGTGHSTPAELTGGTFTVNNYGAFGNDDGDPIINHPEGGILGIGAIRERPWVVDGAGGRPAGGALRLAFDHRICDGGEAGRFVTYIADCASTPVASCCTADSAGTGPRLAVPARTEEEADVHDMVILGGGPGGYATAFRAAARGLDVALVEADLVGGTCLHRGCIPSKAILHVAEVLEEVHRSEVLGLKLTYDGLDGEALDSFRSGVVTRLHKGLDFLVGKRTTFHAGRGRLVRDDDGNLGVEVTGDDGSTTHVAGRHVVLATGSVATSLPGVEIDGEVVQTSDQALWFTVPPKRAVIVGAGAIGMEFASMWRPFGSEVTVVEALDRVLPLEDADCSQAVAVRLPPAWHRGADRRQRRRDPGRGARGVGGRRR